MDEIASLSRYSTEKHGQQLRTGSKSTTPSIIEDRDDELNNMLVEARVSNFEEFIPTSKITRQRSTLRGIPISSS